MHGRTRCSNLSNHIAAPSDFDARAVVTPAVRAQLKVKIGKQQAAKEQKLRRKNLTKYVPNAAAAVFKVLQTMSETPAVRLVSIVQAVSETPAVR